MRRLSAQKSDLQYVHQTRGLEQSAVQSHFENVEPRFDASVLYLTLPI